jgi:hypothetical protein
VAAQGRHAGRNDEAAEVHLAHPPHRRQDARTMTGAGQPRRETDATAPAGVRRSPGDEFFFLVLELAVVVVVEPGIRIVRVLDRELGFEHQHFIEAARRQRFIGNVRTHGDPPSLDDVMERGTAALREFNPGGPPNVPRRGELHASIL